MGTTPASSSALPVGKDRAEKRLDECFARDSKGPYPFDDSRRERQEMETTRVVLIGP